MQTIRVRKGSVGETFWFAHTEAGGGLLLPASIASVTCAFKTEGEGDTVSGNGSQVETGDVLSGYSFGWRFGSTETATARRLLLDITVNKTGIGAIKLKRIGFVVED